MTQTIAVLPGDGTGPEVIREARKVLDAVEERAGLDLSYREVECGARYYEETGEEWEPGGFEFCRDEADAVLLGAVGWPGIERSDGEIAGAGVVFGLRFDLDLYANVRPCSLYEGVTHSIHDEYAEVWDPALVDTVLVRENTEEFYAPTRGSLERGGRTEVAVDAGVVTRRGSERVIRHAFELAGRREGAPGDGESRVTCVDKANVLEGSRLFRSTFEDVAEDYPEVAAETNYVDAFTQWLVRNPEWYDVVVTTNLFGDVVTDLAAVLQGGMGMAASANVGEDRAMFEPVHGSSPDHAGENRVNPLAAVGSAKLMLGWLGRRTDGPEGDRLLAARDLIDEAVGDLLRDGGPRTYDLGGDASTDEVGDALVERVRSGECGD